MSRIRAAGALGLASLVLSFVPFHGELHAQTTSPPPKYEEMSLEELLDTKVAIAAKTEQTPEEAPSIVSVITRHDIEVYGARDLADILRMAGGFELGIDVESLVGMSFRGIWVHEGKALVMIDGQPVNDPGYGNINYIGSYPASVIDRVEIIRGPGSALYGGFAEVATVNVITIKGGELNGGRATLRGAALGSGEFVQAGNISAGGALGNGVTFDVHVGYGKDPLSRRVYQDFFGNSLQLGSENSERDWNHVMAEAAVRNFKVQFLHTELTFLGQDVFTSIAPPLPNGVRTELHRGNEDALQLSYDAKVSDAVTITPLFEYIRSAPLDRPLIPNEVFAGNIGVDTFMGRYRGEITTDAALPWGGRLVAGFGYIRDTVHDVNDAQEGGLLGSDLPGDYVTDRASESRYLLAQYSQRFGKFGVTAGARYEDTTSGSAVAPRAGVTFVDGRFNAKLLYGKAYRIPTPFQQYERDFRGLDLRPETAETVELETGYKLTANLSARVNAFIVSINEPITYVGALNEYENFGFIRSEGFEGELNARFEGFGGFLNVAFAKPGGKTSPGFRADDGSQFLGTQRFKLNLGGYTRVGPLTIAPTVTYLSPRWGQSQDGAVNGTLDSVEYPSRVLVNLNVSAKNVFAGIDLALGVNNLFNTDYVLIQPYYGGHAPLPALDREVSLTLGRSF